MSTSASRLNRTVNVSAPTTAGAGPADAEERLLVAHLHVPDGEEPDQLAVRPELAEPQRGHRPIGAVIDDPVPVDPAVLHPCRAHGRSQPLLSWTRPLTQHSRTDAPGPPSTSVRHTRTLIGRIVVRYSSIAGPPRRRGRGDGMVRRCADRGGRAGVPVDRRSCTDRVRSQHD